jgi:exopolysaccharide production protein ExoQ
LTKLYSSRWQLAAAHSSRSMSAPFSFRVWRARTNANTPISQQVLTWLLFWPLLTLIARHTVYFSGPARAAVVYQNGAAMAGPRGSRADLYVNLLFLLGFVVAGHQQVWTALKRNWLIPAMLALAVCSVFWSPAPIITLQMCAAAGLCALFACYLSERYTADRLMQLLILMGVAAALLSVFFSLALPAYGIFQGYGEDAWQGICDHKNTLGVSMAFLLTPVFFTTSYGRGRKLLYSALLLFLIYKSQSRGAWLDTGAMLLFVAWLSLIRRLRAREVAPVLLVTITAVVATVALGVYFWPELAAHLGKSPSMSGRTGIYAEVWRSIMKRPILGYGFGAFWYAGNPEVHRIGLALGWPNIGYAENGILELALQTGFVGAGFVIMMIGKAVVQGMRLLHSPSYSPRVGWFLTVFFLAMVTNIDAGWFMTVNTLDWVLILISCIGMNEEITKLPA